MQLVMGAPRFAIAPILFLKEKNPSTAHLSMFALNCWIAPNKEVLIRSVKRIGVYNSCFKTGVFMGRPL